MKVRLKEVRQRLHLKQKELARKLNVSPAAICRWEKNQRKMPAIIVYRMNTELGVSLWELFDYGKND